MEKRALQRLGREVSVVGLGTWQLGADWGDVAEEDAMATLEAAIAEGVTFFDTADVYGDGRSEQFCGELHRRHPDVFIATKMGRRVDQLTENYNRDAFLRVERPLAGKPRHVAPRPRPAALPTRRRVRERRRLRRARRDGRLRDGSPPTGSPSRPAPRR